MLSPTVQKHPYFHIILSRDRASHTATPLSCQSLTRQESPTDSFCRLQASSGYSVLNQYSRFNTKYFGAKYYCKQLPPGWETVDDWTKHACEQIGKSAMTKSQEISCVLWYVADVVAGVSYPHGIICSWSVSGVSYPWNAFPTRRKLKNCQESFDLSGLTFE